MKVFANPDEQSKKHKNKREIDPKQTQAFLNRPVKKVENLNQNLKKSYEKGFFNRPSFDHFKILREKRKDKEKDSVESQQNQDSSFEVSAVRPNKSKQHSLSNHSQTKTKGNRKKPANAKRGRKRKVKEESSQSSDSSEQSSQEQEKNSKKATEKSSSSSSSSQSSSQHQKQKKNSIKNAKADAVEQKLDSTTKDQEITKKPQEQQKKNKPQQQNLSNNESQSYYANHSKNMDVVSDSQSKVYVPPEKTNKLTQVKPVFEPLPSKKNDQQKPLPKQTKKVQQILKETSTIPWTAVGNRREKLMINTKVIVQSIMVCSQSRQQNNSLLQQYQLFANLFQHAPCCPYSLLRKKKIVQQSDDQQQHQTNKPKTRKKIIDQ